MNKQKFFEILKDSFLTFLDSSSRSNKKLKILHGAIAADIGKKLGKTYSINSLGFNDKKAKIINGRYLDKKVDIVISKNNKILCGIGLKFVMQNYSQNSNNYFENMLGETANIRSNQIKYFQIFIIPETIPYYKNDNTIKKWEKISIHNIYKYIMLANDKSDLFFHTPDKTLLCVIKLPEIKISIKNKEEYVQYYKNLKNFNITFSDIFLNNFKNNDYSVIYNNYELFIEKLYHLILSI